jgi:hypothetical protein
MERRRRRRWRKRRETKSEGEERIGRQENNVRKQSYGFYDAVTLLSQKVFPDSGLSAGYLFWWLETNRLGVPNVFLPDTTVIIFSEAARFE